jgi:predicted Zn-dependent peptidase
VRVRVRAGSYLDGAMPGLAEATAGMLSRGTRSHTKAEIARRLESVGRRCTGRRSATTSWDAAPASPRTCPA